MASPVIQRYGGMRVPIAIGLQESFSFVYACEIVAINSSELRFVRMNMGVVAMDWRFEAIPLLVEAIGWRCAGDPLAMV